MFSHLRRHGSHEAEQAHSPASRQPSAAVAYSAAQQPAWTHGQAVSPLIPLHAKLTINQPDDVYEQEADRVADQVMRLSEPSIQRQVSEPPASEIAQFEEERQRFEAGQAEFFAEMGQMIRQHILEAAGFGANQRVSTPEDALKVVGHWGISLESLIRNLPEITASLAGQIRGQTTAEDLNQQQQNLIAALTPESRQTYQRMLQKVRSEAFWQRYLDNNLIYIFPDLSGTNRYGGYTQRTTYQTPAGLTHRLFVIHISKDRLNNGQVDEAAATLVHELSHTLYEPTITAQMLRPFTRSLAALLADHPQIAAMRQNAPSPEQARQLHTERINQILYERTGYAEAEIFVHLQQLTHQPSVQIQGETIQSHHYILDTVQGYVSSLRRIGLPPRVLNGILNSLARRVAYLYDRRIAAAPAGSTQRRLLELNKEQALAILGIARNPQPE